jgi:hypothetical protein
MADISRFVPTESTTVTFTNSASTTGWVAYRLFAGGLLYTQSLTGASAGAYTVLVKDSPNGDSRVLYDSTGTAITAYIAPATGASPVPDEAYAAAYFSILLTAGTATCKFHGKT